MNTASLDFEVDVLKSEVPVLVDFTATWCGPCKAIAPIVEELAESFSGRAKVIAVDIDAHGDIAINYGVMSVPTLVVFKGGQEVERMVGAGSKAAIEQMLSKQL